MSQKRQPTIREIALASGRSTCAVSFALRNHPRASKAMRAEIQAIAREMGWRPNPLASAYMAHFRSTRPPAYQATLAFLLSNPAGERTDDLPVYQQGFLTGARLRATELGYSLLPVWLHKPGLNGARLTRLLRNQGIPGVIIPPIMKYSAALQSFDWDAFAAVTSGYTLQEPAIHRVAGHSVHGMQLLLKKTAELGFRNAAVVLSENLHRRTNYEFVYPVYFEQRHRKHGIDVHYHSYEWPLTQAAQDSLRSSIETAKPDVVIGQNFLLDLLPEYGWKIGRDFAFCTIDWSPGLPQIAGLNQLHEVRGALAVDLVSGQLLQNERGLPNPAKLLLVRGKWEDGESMVRLPGPASKKARRST